MTALLLIVSLALLSFALLAAGIGVYVLVTFVVMRAHVEPRPFGHVLRDAWREVWASLLIQPLVPLFYLVGRRLRGGSGRPIVMVHGYTQNRANFLPLTWALGRRGLGPIYGFNYVWLAPIGKSAAALGRFIDAVCAETGAPDVDLVCHSMGGLVAFELARQRGKDAKIRRCVTIASPHAGAAWKGPVLGVSGTEMRQGSPFLTTLGASPFGFEALSIYSSHDNVVHPPTTSSIAARGGRDLALPGGAHLAVLLDPRVHAAVADFLAAEASVGPAA